MRENKATMHVISHLEQMTQFVATDLLLNIRGKASNSLGGNAVWRLSECFSPCLLTTGGGGKSGAASPIGPAVCIPETTTSSEGGTPPPVPDSSACIS